MRHAVLLGLGLLLAACSGASDASDDGSGDDTSSNDVVSKGAAVCAKQSIGADKVVHCTQPFAAAPFIHAPGTEKIAGGKASFTGAIVVSSGYTNPMYAIAPSGARFALVDAHGEPLSFNTPGAILKKLKFPTNLAVARLYAFEGTVGADVDTGIGKLKGLTLTSAQTVVEIDACALVSTLAGTWEGTVSTRFPTPQVINRTEVLFDEKAAVPIRVTLKTGATVGGKLAEWVTGKTSFDNFGLTGTIDNAMADVKDGGESFPSLHALGAKEPFGGATDGAFQLFRLGNMHGLQGDAHFVADYPKGAKDVGAAGMTTDGSSFYAVSAAWLMQASPALDLGEVIIRPHLPSERNGHVIRIHPTKVGAQAGQCGS